jgi:hypothetical protein
VSLFQVMDTIVRMQVLEFSAASPDDLQIKVHAHTSAPRPQAALALHAALASTCLRARMALLAAIWTPVQK